MKSAIFWSIVRKRKMKIFKRILSIVFFSVLPLIFVNMIMEIFNLTAEYERLSTYETTSGSDWLSFAITQGVIGICAFAGLVISSCLTAFNSFKVLRLASAFFILIFSGVLIMIFCF